VCVCVCFKGSEVQYLNSNSPDELLALIKEEEEEEEEKPLSTNTIPNTEFRKCPSAKTERMTK